MFTARTGYYLRRDGIAVEGEVETALEIAVRRSKWAQFKAVDWHGFDKTIRLLEEKEKELKEIKSETT